MNANRWQYALAGAGNLTSNGDGVVYTDAAGTAWQFTPGATVGTYTTPAGLQQTLTKVDNSTTHEYTLKGWTSNSTTHFNLAGQPTSVVDRNQNQISFNTSDGYALSYRASNDMFTYKAPVQIENRKGQVVRTYQIQTGVGNGNWKIITGFPTG